MDTPIDPKQLWFSSIPPVGLCRLGGNGPKHPSQLYAIKKYAKAGMSLLDYGCGSATTLEALILDEIGDLHQKTRIKYKYRGVDTNPENIDWCKENFPFYKDQFSYNPTLHKIDQPDSSFDVVYSRHVVDHMDSFEKAMDEHKRVASKLIIVILWVDLAHSDEHFIKNITDQGKVYEHEFTNQYSRNKVLEYLNADPGWKLLEFTEAFGREVQGSNTIIVLERV